MSMQPDSLARNQIDTGSMPGATPRATSTCAQGEEEVCLLQLALVGERPTSTATTRPPPPAQGALLHVSERHYREARRYRPEALRHVPPLLALVKGSNIARER